MTRREFTQSVLGLLACMAVARTGPQPTRIRERWEGRGSDYCVWEHPIVQDNPAWATQYRAAMTADGMCLVKLEYLP